MKEFMWVEKYRPKTIQEYIFKNQLLEKKIKEYLAQKEIPHLLLVGPSGTGKTALAKVILNELKVDVGDILEINASLENRIEVIRDNIINFVSSYSFGGLRYVLLDEADYLTHHAQAALRNLMERYHDNARFILTANYSHKIIQALKSRCQMIVLDNLDSERFLERGVAILENENIQYDDDVLAEFFRRYYPDLRKFINSLQLYSIDGRLVLPDKDEKETKDCYYEILNLFRQGKIYEARQLIVDNLEKEEYIDFYRFVYDHRAELAHDSLDKEYKIVYLLKKYMVDHALCADPEINLAAFLVELQLIADGS